MSLNRRITHFTHVPRPCVCHPSNNQYTCAHPLKITQLRPWTHRQHGSTRPIELVPSKIDQIWRREMANLQLLFFGIVNCSSSQKTVLVFFIQKLSNAFSAFISQFPYHGIISKKKNTHIKSGSWAPVIFKFNI